MNMKGVLQITILMLAATLLVLPVSGAFTVTGITPDTGINTGTVFVTNLSGTDLPQDASVRCTLAGQSNITGQFITWVDPTRITCVLDLAGKAAGDWDVVVVNNTDALEAVLPAGFSVRNPAPTVTAITPDEGVNTGTVQITSLAGTNFLANASVVLVKTDETNITGTGVVRTGPTELECEFDLTGAATGAWDVVVTNSDGQYATLPGGFMVRYPAPVVTAITPASGKNNEVIGITNLAGNSFRPAATVVLTKTGQPDITTINGPIVNPDKILCFFDLSGKAVGAWNVMVTNPDGQYDVLPAGFTIFYPEAPTVTGITPATGENSGTVGITNLAGTGFQPGASVKLTRSGQPDIPGTPVDVTSSSKITCEFNLSDAQTGTWNVVVANNDGQSATLAGSFTITYPAPTLSEVIPDSGLNSGPITITNLSGTGFLDGATVTLFRGGEPDIDANPVNIENPERISCTVDLTGAEPGLWSIRVTNPDAQAAELPDAFTIVYPPPAVGGIAPTSGTVGEIVPANVSGNYFLPGVAVNLTKTGEANVSAAVFGTTPTKITCEIDLTGVKAGLWSLTVINPDGQEASLPDTFIVHNPAPVVIDAAPGTGVNSGNTGLINLNGTGFLNDALVKLARSGEPDITGKGIVIESDTLIHCFFDLSGVRAGFWDVVVTNTDMLSGTLPEGFFISYPAAPSVTGIDPDSGVNTGPVTITHLSGTGFKDGATVTLLKSGESNISGTGVVVAAPDRITCNFDLTGAKTGAWDVLVTNDDGQQGLLAGGFSVSYPAPVVRSITPDTGINTGPVTITNLSGSGFRPGATVTFTKLGEPDIEATGVTVVHRGKITCTVNLAKAAAGLWNIVVVNDDSQYGILTNAFRVEYPAPTVTSITPSQGANDGPVFISALQGTGFLQNATIQLTRNGYAPITATGVTVESPTMITCTLNLTGRATGDWNVFISNTDGKTGGRANAFKITPPLSVPNFTASPELGTAPLIVQFTDLSTNNVTQWRWDFGDGAVMTGNNLRNPVHTYNDPGIYTVKLIVWNEAGQTLTSAKQVITVVKTPVASFEADPVSGPAPLVVRFTDTSDGTPLRWLWRFGDGRYSTQQNPYYLYEKPGLYTVTLTVSNRAGSNTTTKPDLIEVTSLPEAGFTANRTSGISPLSVKFTDTSTGNPTSWVWKFGDNGTSTQKNPVHVYTLPGTYSVQLTASNNAGTSTETKSGYIVVGYELMAEFEYTTSNSDNTAPLTVAFMDCSTGKPSRWFWTFGDGYRSTEENPIHTYTRPGLYNITLTVTGSSGSDSVTKSILVKSPLKAEFVAEPTTGSAPLTVRLSDTSIGEPVTRNWIFIDPADPEDLRVIVIEDGPRDLVYTFNEPGLYTVLLDVWDASGEEDVAAREDFINVFPFP
jgi:PKD repeat protein